MRPVPKGRLSSHSVRVSGTFREQALNRRPLPVAALIGLLILHTSVCLAQNLATNPGFETGNTSGWFPFGSPTISVQTTQVHSGTYSAIVQNRTRHLHGYCTIPPERSSSWPILQHFSLGPHRQRHESKCPVDHQEDRRQRRPVRSGRLRFRQFEPAWTQLSGTYTLSVSGTLTGLTLYAEVPSSSTIDYYLDDLSVVANTSSSSGTNGTSTVNWTDLRQRIDGFGASSAWRSTWNSTVADTYFSTNTGLGLSLLRTRIAPGGTTVENTIMQFARDRGARVWSAPWSPAPQAHSRATPT